MDNLCAISSSVCCGEIALITTDEVFRGDEGIDPLRTGDPFTTLAFSCAFSVTWLLLLFDDDDDVAPMINWKP